MAYAGYLLKFGNYIFPDDKIKPSSYKPYVNMQDLDDYTDADGYLHREAVELKAEKVELELVPMLTNTEFEQIMSQIRANYTNPQGREGYITAYIPEYDDYVTQKGYLADFQPSIYGTYDGVIHYDSIRLAFIGGVYGD